MKKHLLVFTFLVFSINIFAQEALKSTEEEYYDFLSLQGLVERPTLGYRTLSDSVWNLSEETEHVWAGNNLGSNNVIWQSDSPADNWFARGMFQGFKYKIYGPEWFNSYNTAAPYGQNDGALWQGRGYNTSLTAGARLEGYGFEVTVKPQVSFSQNQDFESNPDVYPDSYSYSFKNGTVNHKIDLVRRYGDSSFWNYDWGDSEIRWSWHSLTFGFGTQNPWLGPAYLNPMLGSNNAGGYLKFDAGLRKTDVIIPGINWNLGSIEGRIWVGQLKESDYFDNNPDNNDRMLTAMSASYQPSFIPGLTVGLNRIFMTYWRTENLKYVLRLFTASRSNALASSGNDEDQKFSLFAEWNFPKVGFNVYGEFGRDDFSSNEDTNPFHTAIYTIGIKQIIPFLFGLKSEFNFEWNDFEMSQDFQFQWPYRGFYAHGFVKQGYTNNGQLLGAGAGSFGNSQYLSYKVYYPKGFTAIKFHRYCPNNNSIYSIAVKNVSDALSGPLYSAWYSNFETFFCYGIETNYFVTDSINLDFAFNYIRIYNYNYIRGNIINNFNFNLNLKYNL